MKQHLRSVRLPLLAVLLIGSGCTQRPANDARSADKTAPTSSVAVVATDPIISKIRDEGLNRSKVMETLDYLCNSIGPRLTGSPNAKRANEWTRDTLASWGLSNSHLEAWGPFGRGWSVKRFSMQVVSPQTIVLNGYPKAWSPGFDKPFEAEVVYVDATDEKGLAKFKGKLKGKVVLTGTPREVQARFEPLANRIKDEDLLKLANAQSGSSALLGQPRTQTAGERRAQFAESSSQGQTLLNRNRDGATSAPAATQATSRPARGGRGGASPFATRLLSFVTDEGASIVVTASSQGDGGTFYVQSANIPGDSPFGGAGPSTATASTNASTSESTTGPTSRNAATTRPRVWSKDAPKIPAQVTLAVEDFNRLARMAKRGETMRMNVDLSVQFHDNDDMAYNTIAEIPGSDLKDEIVIVGAHLDSWQSGTGCTDNGVGSASAMEAVRIIKALNLQPRRTIRVALWTGEEQGIFGSAAYVKKHFGSYPTDDRPRARRDEDSDLTTRPATRPARTLTKLPDYEKLSVYFNLDNGTGKIRGIYAQQNAKAVPLFKDWLTYFHDLGANTVTISNTGSTDHIPFDSVGLPGFQFIQDPIEYGSRTHHSNMDVYDRAQAEDLKQASTIMAAFVWKAANMNERFPRKPEAAATGR